MAAIFVELIYLQHRGGLHPHYAMAGRSMSLSQRKGRFRAKGHALSSRRMGEGKFSCMQV
eukprot:scaffold60763_cov33-Tisochrysis_lutea.AAC.4